MAVCRTKIRTAIFFVMLSIISIGEVAGQKISAHELINSAELTNYLKPSVKSKINSSNAPSEKELAAYFRAVFAERYFYDWHTFNSRFLEYNKLYENKHKHVENAHDHLQKFADSTNWKLPFFYLSGEAVNAYALRHLARQHKMVDIAFQYFYSDKDPQYINYFVNQMQSLNAALEANKYETIKDGNGVYEAFRSGYRVLNWLQIHNMFLGEAAYTDQYQLQTIATLLQHGQNLYETNQSFSPGNHQTRGASALAMLAILFSDFEGTDLWYQQAMKLLNEHLNKEINNDGFQFERSVHYHISDISNYFYVYQLSKISKLNIDAQWEEKLRSLFTTLVKIAYPNKSAPVLQDDTDNPWAEQNDISGALTLGYLLFEDAEFGYFAHNKVDDRIYWNLQQRQLDLLNTISKQKPQYGSVIFPDTKYYIMRNGWDNDDNLLIISAGVDAEKPDHQHGDILGIQAYAKGNVVLPNYQVNYPLPDFEFFKNSMVKNVALVDDELQGKLWTGNKGGSGFGKFKQLPTPKTIAFTSADDFDFFAGTHNGFENVGVTYSRQVISVKDGFWIVKDNFTSEKPHQYKQVWQGHYTLEESPNLLRSTFADASGCDILQLNTTDTAIISGLRGKQWAVVSKSNENNFSFVTVIYPYKGFANRINENQNSEFANGWTINKHAANKGAISLTKETVTYWFNLTELNIKGIKIEFSEKADVFVQEFEKSIRISSLYYNELQVNISGNVKVNLNEIGAKNTIRFKPSDKLYIETKD